MTIEIKAAEAAALMRCDIRSVQRKVSAGKLPATTRYNAHNRPEYYIPLTALPAEAQKQYHAQHSIAAVLHPPAVDAPTARPADCYSAAEREEIDYWVTLLERWQYYRGRTEDASKSVIDERFVAQCRLEYPDRAMSIDILYRRWRSFRNQDMDGLLDKRGKARAGECSLPDEVISAFFGAYLTQSKLSIPRCMKAVEQWARTEMPTALPLPAYSTFHRKVQELPMAVRILCREGDKAYYDKCSPHIKRRYETLGANDWWVGDTYTCDVMVLGKDGTKYRPYLSAWVDVRSGVFVGWHIAFESNSQNTIYALRRAVTTHGLPNNNFYIDNGREYLTYDLGGRGHRAKKHLADGSEAFAPPGIFQRMEVGMVNAVVCNARAKLVERSFLDLKNFIMKLFPTYTGGNVKEKPERLKHVLKTDAVPTVEEFVEKVDKLIEGYLNYEPYYGGVEEDRGKRRIDVFFQRRLKMRKPKAEALHLMLLRTSRPVTVKRNGIEIDVRGGVKVLYFAHELCNQMQGKKVYARYDPDDLSSVRVYDEDDRFMLVVPRSDLVANYGDTQEVISTALKKQSKAKKALKDYINTVVAPNRDIDPLALMLDLASNNISNPAKDSGAKLIQLEYTQEQPLLQAVGDVDLAKMNHNFILQNGGLNDE